MKTDEAKLLKAILTELRMIGDKLGVERPVRPASAADVVSVNRVTGEVRETGDVPPALTEERRQVMAAQTSDKRLRPDRRVDRQPVEGRGTR